MASFRINHVGVSSYVGITLHASNYKLLVTTTLSWRGWFLFESTLMGCCRMRVPFISWGIKSEWLLQPFKANNLLSTYQLSWSVSACVNHSFFWEIFISTSITSSMHPPRAAKSRWPSGTQHWLPQRAHDKAPNSHGWGWWWYLLRCSNGFARNGK